MIDTIKPKIKEDKKVRLNILLTFSISLNLCLGRNLVNVTPNPVPISAIKMLIVDLKTPISPLTVLPKVLATIIQAKNIKPFDIKVPINDQMELFNKLEVLFLNLIFTSYFV